MPETNDIQQPEMTYKPPPINPPSPMRLVLVTLSAVFTIAAFFAARAGADLGAMGGLIVGQLLLLLSERTIPYVGPPINPPVPPRRVLEVLLEAVAIVALGLALFDLGRQPGTLFTTGIAVAVAAQVGLAVSGLTAGARSRT